jgi:2-amino-4-hydroxy-6-hydroxymethyldihydropteridine diphosphokinase
MRLGVGLGSNLGDRAAHLREAVLALQKNLHVPGAEFLVSGIFVTAPVDCAPETPDFFNAVVELESTHSPREVLQWTRNWEETHGRPREHGFHEPRTIDLDLLYFGDFVLDEPDLILPHPRARNRLFVLAPLAEINPHCQPTGWPDSVGRLCAALREAAAAENQPIPRRLPGSLWTSA